MSNDHLPSVISHEFSSNDVLVFRSEIKDFTTKSQLIVHQTQEALFVKEGEALDLFGAGRHSLSTDNVPLLKKLIQKIFKNEKTIINNNVELSFKNICIYLKELQKNNEINNK